MFAFLFNVLLLASVLFPHPARCSFEQAWHMPELKAGDMALIYPSIISGQAYCGGMYTYSYKYWTNDGFESFLFVGLGFGIDPQIEVTPPADSEGDTLTVWTEFKCLTCGHTSVYQDSAVVQDPD